jgi:peptidoglycan/LPS O-acetylase OafA/YrhL
VILSLTSHLPISNHIVTESARVLDYRREIDGLRALAIISVILFHAGFQAFSGGFIGVDVFFVISGYLITSIILAERQAGTFTLVGFYERRARRILPALFVVSLACVPFALLWMLQDELENFGQSLVAVTLFSNNILLWLTSGYFHLENEFKPLVQTWSLGVEEQYYVLFPLFIILFWRFGTRWLAFSLVIVAILSLLLAQWGVSYKPQAAFLLLPTRGWELLIGALSAFALHNKSVFVEKLRSQAAGQLLGVIGLSLIAYSIFWLDKYTPFPGVYALLPTAGTALLILFATEQTVVGQLLGINALVFIGLLSYSAYLWHQPLFAFARLRSLVEPDTSVFLGLGLLSLMIAYPTWRYVEKPFRDRVAIGQNTIALVFPLVGLFVSCVGFVIYVNYGFSHFREELNAGINPAGRLLNAAYNERPLQFKRSLFTAPQKHNVLVLGDSFARDFINSGVENNYFSSSEISYIDDIPWCSQSGADIPEPLRSLISVADYLIISYITMPVDCWRADFDIFKKLGAQKLVVIGPKNFGWNMNAVMLLDQNARYNYRAQVLKDTVSENERLAHTLSSEYFVNLLSLLSDGYGRVPVFTEDHQIISPDKFHLTKEGAKFVGKVLFEHPLLSPLK